MTVQKPMFGSVFGSEECGLIAPDSPPNEPEFTAQRDEGFRYKRLNLVWGHACATVRLMSNRYQDLWNGSVVELEDSKGVLNVTWRDNESRLAFEGVIVGAWEANAEHSHIHFLVNR